MHCAETALASALESLHRLTDFVDGVSLFLDSGHNAVALLALLCMEVTLPFNPNPNPKPKRNPNPNSCS